MVTLPKTQHPPGTVTICPQIAPSSGSSKMFLSLSFTRIATPTAPIDSSPSSTSLFDLLIILNGRRYIPDPSRSAPQESQPPTSAYATEVPDHPYLLNIVIPDDHPLLVNARP